MKIPDCGFPVRNMRDVWTFWTKIEILQTSLYFSTMSSGKTTGSTSANSPSPQRGVKVLGGKEMKLYWWFTVNTILYCFGVFLVHLGPQGLARGKENSGEALFWQEDREKLSGSNQVQGNDLGSSKDEQGLYARVVGCARSLQICIAICNRWCIHHNCSDFLLVIS